MLQRQVSRVALTDTDRSLLGAIAAALPRPRRVGWIVTPDTLLRWHKRRIARHWTHQHRSPGRPSATAEIRRLIIAMAADNPTWGYRRVHGELTNLGHQVGASTVWRILKHHGINPAPERSTVTWTQFLRSQAAVACDFASVDTPFLRRYYLLFFIDITTREVFFAGITTNTTGAWTTQAARNLFQRHADQLTGSLALVRDRGSQFTDSFDEIFRTEGFKILKTPVRTPIANTFAERWIRTLRRELLDRTIIWNQDQLEQLVVDYIDHYNTHRPHRSLDQKPPRPAAPIRAAPSPNQPNLTLQRPHQRIPTRRLTSHDRVLGTHRSREPAHEALIPMDDWQAVQDVFTAGTRASAPKRRAATTTCSKA